MFWLTSFVLTFFCFDNKFWYCVSCLWAKITVSLKFNHVNCGWVPCAVVCKFACHYTFVWVHFIACYIRGLFIPKRYIVFSELFTLLDFYCNLELSVSKGKISSSSFFPDGIHRVVALCTLRVTIITDDMLTNSITVRLENMSQERFLSPLLSLFLEGVADVLSTKREAVFVFNIQNDTDVQGSILNVTFSALQPGGAPGKGMFFPSEELQEQIYLHRTRLRLISTQEVTHSPEVKNIRSISRRNKCS